MSISQSASLVTGPGISGVKVYLFGFMGSLCCGKWEIFLDKPGSDSDSGWASARMFDEISSKAAVVAFVRRAVVCPLVTVQL